MNSMIACRWDEWAPDLSELGWSAWLNTEYVCFRYDDTLYAIHRTTGERVYVGGDIDDLRDAVQVTPESWGQVFSE